MDVVALTDAVGLVFYPGSMIFIILGALAGVIIGAIPGLTATMSIALLIPFTFGMSIIPAMGMLLGVFFGAMYGGSIAAILINTPGTPAAAATVLDGYPMSKRGEAGRALSIALFATVCGGITGSIAMTFLSPFISRWALRFGPAEYFVLAVFGLSVIISISGKSIVKGLIVAFFGLLITTVGMDSMTAYFRFTNHLALLEGIPFIPALIGLFAVSEVFNGIENILTGEKIKAKISGVLPSRADFKAIGRAVATGSLVGTFAGTIPGVGSDIAAFVSYSEAKRTSRHPEKFGTGAPEGVASAESANSACACGSMIPMLSLGVPGDSNTAVLMGAFILQGFQPGPMMYVQHLNIVYAVFITMFLSNIAVFIVGLSGVKFFAKIISIDRKMLIPAILVLSLVGAFAINRNMFDVFLAIGFGGIGYLLQKYQFPLSPILLALILGPMAEDNLRRYMLIVDGQIMQIFTRPISVTLLLLAVASLVASVLNQRKINKRMAAAGGGGVDNE
ncbi:MAG: tripartite tricarboxylate transporter permease [Spirochaetes bacterium]|nr:tripartite tricarboxylate transporter permease [Spirochaetota bacterium]